MGSHEKLDLRNRQPSCPSTSSGPVALRPILSDGVPFSITLKVYHRVDKITNFQM